MCLSVERENFHIHVLQQHFPTVHECFSLRSCVHNMHGKKILVVGAGSGVKLEQFLPCLVLCQ